jgi:hypothetical protein
MKQPMPGNSSTPPASNAQKQQPAHGQQRAQSKLENLLEESATTLLSPIQHQHQQHPSSLHIISPLIFNSPTASSTTSSSSSYPNTASSTVNILLTPPLSSPNSVHNYQFATSLKAQHAFMDSPHSSSAGGVSGGAGSGGNAAFATTTAANLGVVASKLNGALIDLDLYQTRYCSRLRRKSCLIECLVSLDHRHGDFIEVRACAPERWREELFYFTQDLYMLIEQWVSECCVNLHLERHYLQFKPVRVSSDSSDNGSSNNSLSLGVVNYDAIYSPRDLITLQLDKGRSGQKLVDLACCGSEQIERTLIQGVDLPVAQLNDYARHMLCTLLDKTDPMGRDWSILGFLLGLQDQLPRLDEEAVRDPSMSKCAFLLAEWTRQTPEQATVRTLLSKVRDLGRTDVHEMLANSVDLFKVNVSKDSGIQNSNQTLASLK